MPLNRKLRIFLNYAVGLVIFAWVSYMIYRSLLHQPHLGERWRDIRDSLVWPRSGLLLATIGLMLVNWGIEARKWQLLVRQVEPFSFRKAYFSVLTGVSISLNTPNRVGEYAGRVLYLQPANRLRGISLNMVTSVSQLIVTMVMGIAGLCYLLTVFTTDMLGSHGLTPFWMHVILYGGAIFCAGTIILYFRLSWLVRILEGIPGMQRIKPYISVLDHYEWPLLARMLLLSAIRFVVFVTQYILMFRLLHVEVTWAQGFWAVSVLMLILALIPTIAIAELPIRLEASKAFLNLFSPNDLGIDAASFGIWIINLIIPALLGSLLILGIKIIKE